MARTWMPMYWGDYLRDTRHFDTTQHGMYLLLIAHYWQHGELPNDERQLATIAGVSVARWRTLSPPVAAKFGTGWTHGRIDKEIARADKKIVLRQMAGHKGGVRSGISRAIAQANASANAQANGQAKIKQSRTNHKEVFITSSEQDAARAERLPAPSPPAEAQQGGRWEQGAKPPHETSRAELDEMITKRRGGATSPQPTQEA